MGSSSLEVMKKDVDVALRDVALGMGWWFVSSELSSLSSVSSDC